MKILRLGRDSEYLPSVIDLWRKNSRTLGFFPEGAFEEHAAKQCILVACGVQGDLLGYLLFRLVKMGETWPQATIVHLCVDAEHRGKGVARALVDELRDLISDRFLRINLSCRRDYAANDLWPRLGFKYADERLGRSGNPVIIWQMDLRPLPLIALLQQKESEGRFRAVIDANVLYRLQDPIPVDPAEARALSEEAKALEEDWLSADVVLFITDETFNEIQKNNDPDERASRLAFARRYNSIVTELEDVKRMVLALRSLFPASPTKSTVSDMRQLAHAIAGAAHFFITQDSGLLKRSDEILSRLGVGVLSPGELIGRIDEMIREAEYYPERLAGSRVMTSKMSSDQISLSHAYFGHHQHKEKKRHLQKKLRAFIANPSRYEVLVSWKDDRPLSLIVYDWGNPQELTIPILRVSRSSLSGTVLRYLISQAVLASASEGRVVTRVIADYFGNETHRALEEIGFAQVDDQWVKINLAMADTSQNLLERLSHLGDQSECAGCIARTIACALEKAVGEQDRLALSNVEHRLWPAKIVDASIPAYIVAVAPTWAQHLFDEGIARQTLWGAREELALGIENVYYRSARNSRGIGSPARVLWYVTHDRRIPASRHIRACSSLDEVVVGKPKQLFRRFRRLGVYGWHDVLRTAKGNLERDIMALRFSSTELLPSPISLEDVREVLQNTEGIRPVLQSPQPISSTSFARLYSAGTRAD